MKPLAVPPCPICGNVNIITFVRIWTPEGEAVQCTRCLHIRPVAA